MSSKQSESNPTAADHLDLNAPAAKPAALIADINDRRAAQTFMVPAILVNDFTVTFTPASVRLVSSERDSAGEQHIRSVVAMDYDSLFNLGNLIDQLRKTLVAQFNGFNADEATKDQVNEKAANDTQAKVGE